MVQILMCRILVRMLRSVRLDVYVTGQELKNAARNNDSATVDSHIQVATVDSVKQVIPSIIKLESVLSQVNVLQMADKKHAMVTDNVSKLVVKQSVIAIQDLQMMALRNVLDAQIHSLSIQDVKQEVL